MANAGTAGALAAVLVNDRPGVPPTLNPGQGTPAIPSVFVTQDKGALLKTAAVAGPVQVVMDPAQRISLTNTMEISSSRGPSQMGASIKPDLGAPGAWTSAVAGTGTVERPFSGTSGATPVVAAAAAILRQAFPAADPAAVKRRLVSSADINTLTVDIEGNITPTPVTRIGGGEVRPYDALQSNTQVGDPGNGDGNLSIGVQNATGKKYVMKKITLTNTSGQSKRYVVEPSFRKQADADSRAITVMAPDSVTVAAGATVTVPIVFAINADRLPAWPFYDSSQNLALAGAAGNNANVLDDAEVDGHLTVLDSDGNEVGHVGLADAAQALVGHRRPHHRRHRRARRHRATHAAQPRRGRWRGRLLRADRLERPPPDADHGQARLARIERGGDRPRQRRRPRCG